MSHSPFTGNAALYDRWYDEAPEVYAAEIRALRHFMPVSTSGRSLEIGVGSGRFAAYFKVTVGLDPCLDMLQLAAGRGVTPVCAQGETLPFVDGSFSCVSLVTVLCFVDRPAVMLEEIRRVLTPGGRLVIAFIDRDTPLGRTYEAKKEKSRFYASARFRSAAEVAALLVTTGFTDLSFVQTLSAPLDAIDAAEAILEGSGRGGFAVCCAHAPKEDG